MKKSVWKKKLSLVVCLCMLLCAALFIPKTEAQAASAKTKAQKAYTKFLEKKSIRLGGRAYSMKKCQFALAYIDNNSVPELMIRTSAKMGNDHIYALGLYTYKGGKVVELLAQNLGLLGDYSNRYSYFKKKGIFQEEFGHGQNISKSYYKISGTKAALRLEEYRTWDSGMGDKTTYSAGTGKKLKKAEYTKKLRKLTGGKNKTEITLVKNNMVNRKKYLK